MYVDEGGLGAQQPRKVGREVGNRELNLPRTLGLRAPSEDQQLEANN